MRLPPLEIKILLESTPLKSRVFVRRLAVPTPRFGAPKAYLPTCLLIWRSMFFADTSLTYLLLLFWSVRHGYGGGKHDFCRIHLLGPFISLHQLPLPPVYLSFDIYNPQYAVFPHASLIFVMTYGWSLVCLSFYGSVTLPSVLFFCWSIYSWVATIPLCLSVLHHPQLLAFRALVSVLRNVCNHHDIMMYTVRTRNYMCICDDMYSCANTCTLYASACQLRSGRPPRRIPRRWLGGSHLS